MSYRDILKTQFAKKVKDNPNPIYGFSFTLQDCKLFDMASYILYPSDLEVKFLRLHTFVDADGKLREYDEDKLDSYARYPELRMPLVSDKYTLGKWNITWKENLNEPATSISMDKELDALGEYVRDLFKKGIDDRIHSVTFSFYSQDWNECKARYHEFRAALPDKKWIEKRRNDLDKAFGKDGRKLAKEQEQMDKAIVETVKKHSSEAEAEMKKSLDEKREQFPTGFMKTEVPYGWQNPMEIKIVF